MKESIKPVIVAVAYNRASSLKRLLESIGNGKYDESDILLIISIDFCENNEDVLSEAHSFQWKYGDKKVVTHTSNLGLRRHILECGNYAIKYGAAIILEDDLIVAPGFYKYAKAAQNFYSDEERVAGIALYSHEWNGYARKRFAPVMLESDVYFGQFGVSWGQCWTGKQWSDFITWYEQTSELSIQNNMPDTVFSWSANSWGKYFVYYIIEKNKYYVMPYNALSTCFSEAGVHTNNISLDNQVCLQYGVKNYQFIKFEEGMHYDIFFENMDLNRFLRRYIGDEENVCINLYGLKSKELEKEYKYILTTQKRNEKIIHAFAREMRPIEMNIIYDIPGNEIFLYENGKSEIKRKTYTFKELNYEAQGMPWQDALYYGLIRAVYGIKMIVEAWLKKGKKK